MTAALLAGTLLGSTGCFHDAKAPTTPLQASGAVPAAAGTVGTTRDSNGNTRVTVAVRHLAPPDKLPGGASFYVVWAKPNDQPAQNLGTLRVDADLHGVLEAVTPLRNFELLVTPEKEPTPQAPASDSVLHADVHVER